MKKVWVSLVNDEFKESPGDDDPMFPLYLEECPMVGDFLFISEPEDCDKDEWVADMYTLCEEMLPKPKTEGYQFKVIDRTMMRSELESWWLIHLIYIPGIHDNTNH